MTGREADQPSATDVEIFPDPLRAKLQACNYGGLLRWQKLVLDSRGSLEERFAHQRKLRDLSSWTDDEGMTAGRFRLIPEVGAAVMNKFIGRVIERQGKWVRLGPAAGERSPP